MKIVVLDSYCVRPGDLDWSGLYAFADVVEEYPRTPREMLIERLRDADLAVNNKCYIDEEVLQACPKLRWIGLMSTGIDKLDLDACHAHGVAVANVPGYSTNSVAQHTFALLLEIANGVAARDASVRDGYWQVDVPEQHYGIRPHFELAGRTFGVVGYGAIGQAAARIAKGFGMRVVAYTRHVKPEYVDHGVEFVPFEQLLEESDVVSLHCPATGETWGMMNASALAAMKQGAILLNTARGALVDEAAVCAALKSGHLSYYASDVAAHEPVRATDALLHCPNVLLTPHVAWATEEALARLSAEVCANLEAFLQGQRRNLV